jgi:hypothetical protein
MSASFGSLGDDEVTTGGDCGDCVSNLSAHARDENVVVVAEVDDITRNAESGNKHAAAIVDDGLHLCRHIARRSGKKINAERFVCRGANKLHLFDHAIDVHR